VIAVTAGVLAFGGFGLFGGVMFGVVVVTGEFFVIVIGLFFVAVVIMIAVVAAGMISGVFFRRVWARRGV